jgi:hypothetical protein
MSNPSNQGHYVKRIVLPSGKTIDVVYFSDAVSELTAPRPQGATQQPLAGPAEHLDLHVCPDCYSELVYPTSWEEAKPREWRVTLRCPECEWIDEGSYPQDVVDRFDEVLDLGTEALINDLRQLTCANMAEEIDRFVHALDAEAIQPMDF